MKLDNRNLALKGLLEVLPPRLERYTRSVLGERTSPEALRRLLAADGPAPEVEDGAPVEGAADGVAVGAASAGTST